VMKRPKGQRLTSVVTCKFVFMNQGQHLRTSRNRPSRFPVSTAARNWTTLST
jgi:hypothetical protein